MRDCRRPKASAHELKRPRPVATPAERPAVKPARQRRSALTEIPSMSRMKSAPSAGLIDRGRRKVHAS
jgi:hypothetical protein